MALALHFLGLFFIFCAFGLMVIVSVSVPIWRQIDFMNSFDRQYLLGIWGATIEGRTAIMKYGYEAVASAQGREVILIHKNISYGLLLNPIAAGFALIALFAALFTNTACGILASLLAFWAFIVTLAALGYDLYTFIVARNRFNSLIGEGAGRASLGKAMWFVVAAAGSLLLGSMMVCFTHSSHKRKRSARDYEDRPTSAYGRSSHEGTLVGEEPVYAEKKHHFWQKKQNRQSQQPVYVEPAQPAPHTAY